MRKQSLRRVRWYNSFVFRFSAINMVVVIALVSGVIYRSHQRDRLQLVERFSEVLRTIAVNAAPLIDGGSLIQVQSNTDAAKSAFLNARKTLEGIRKLNGLAEDAIYILRPSPEKDGRYAFVVMLQKRTFIGDTYDPPEKIMALYEQALLGQAVESPLFEDDHGTFISGVAPIKDADGRVVALLQADIRLAEYLETLREETRYLVGFAILILLVIMFLSSILRNKLANRIGELMKGTMALNSNDFSVRVRLDTADELEQLGRSINVALEHLQERSEMLKFLPEHTQKMIARVLDAGAAQVELTEARDIDVAIMETDIRGFTALAEKLKPADTIALINKYISLQAEIVSDFGGSIDKYMGDAVLVIFEGEDATYRAIGCAKNILREVAKLNESATQPVHIGIGLSFGPVVMGNMGSESRMEHTVIGPSVNLAARLCSLAKPGQLVIPSHLYEAHAAAFGSYSVAMAQAEVVEVKGFTDSIDIFRIE